MGIMHLQTRVVWHLKCYKRQLIAKCTYEDEHNFFKYWVVSEESIWRAENDFVEIGRDGEITWAESEITCIL